MEDGLCSSKDIMLCVLLFLIYVHLGRLLRTRHTYSQKESPKPLTKFLYTNSFCSDYVHVSKTEPSCFASLLFLIATLARQFGMCSKNLTFLLIHPCFEKEKKKRSLIDLNNNFRCSLHAKNTQLLQTDKRGEKK